MTIFYEQSLPPDVIFILIRHVHPLFLIPSNLLSAFRLMTNGQTFRLTPTTILHEHDIDVTFGAKEKHLLEFHQARRCHGLDPTTITKYQ